MKKQDIENKLLECFKKCALGRIHLKKCVNNAMNAGLTKQDIISISDEMATGNLRKEASLCAVTAIGQALKFEKSHKLTKNKILKSEEKINIKNKLKLCFKKCGYARKQLRKCITNALKLGLTKEEILVYTDDVIGGLEKNEISVCAIVAVEEVLKQQEINNLKKTIKMYAPYMEFKE